MKSRKTSIRFDVYRGYEIRVLVSPDICKTGARLGVDLRSCEAAVVTHPYRPHIAWVVLPRDASADTIAHEASHAIRAMFASVGARTDNENFAYHLGYLVGRIHRFMEIA